MVFLPSAQQADVELFCCFAWGLGGIFLASFPVSFFIERSEEGTIGGTVYTYSETYAPRSRDQVQTTLSVPKSFLDVNI